MQCEGILPNTVIGTFFDTKESVVEHRKKYCYDVNGWEGCPMARAINARVEVENEQV